MKWWDQMLWSLFSECWVLSQLFHSLLSLSSRGSLALLHFLPLGWYHLHTFNRVWEFTFLAKSPCVLKQVDYGQVIQKHNHILLHMRSHGQRNLVGYSPWITNNQIQLSNWEQTHAPGDTEILKASISHWKKKILLQAPLETLVKKCINRTLGLSLSGSDAIIWGQAQESVCLFEPENFVPSDS